MGFFSKTEYRAYCSRCGTGIKVTEKEENALKEMHERHNITKECPGCHKHQEIGWTDVRVEKVK